MSGQLGFDGQAAWLRRFERDAQDSLGAFALRVKEALPDRVEIRRSRGGLFGGLLGGLGRTEAMSVELGQNRYLLELSRGRLRASIALVVRGIALNTRAVEPGEWFARLAEETRAASADAEALSRSLADFMAR